MRSISYRGCRFPPDIIQHGVWLYLRFALSFRDVEDLLAERGIVVSYETIRRWVAHFGPLMPPTCVAGGVDRTRSGT
jgi:putative transposase